MAEIDSLEIKIGTSSNTAVEKINALASSLEKLKRTGGGDLSETAKKIEALAKATSSLKGTGEDIKNFAEGLKSLSGLGKIKIPDKLAEKIQALSNAAQGLSSANENITNLGNAAQKLSELGKISIPKNLPDRLHEIGAAMEDITPEAISRLDGMASSLQKLSGIDLKGLPGALRAARSQKSLLEVPETPEMPTAGESDTDFVEPTQVEDTSNKLSILGRAAELAKASIAALEAKFPALAKAIKIAGDAASKFGSALKSAGKAAGSLLLSGIKSAGTAVANDFISPFKNAVKAVSTWKSAIGRIAFYRIVRGAIKAVTDGFKAGIENLYQYSTLVGTSFAPAMNQLATSSLYLKNSLGAMAAPLIQAVAPAIDFVIDKFVALLNVIGKVFAALSGRSTYTQAVKKAATYGEDLDKSMGGAAKSAKDMQHYLLGIDELNVIEAPDDKNNGGGGGGGAGGGFGDMFEEVQIPAETMDWVQQIKDAIARGDWQGAGALLAGKLNSVLDSFDATAWGNRLGELIDHGIQFAYGFMSTMDFTGIGDKLAELVNGAFEKVDFSTAGRLFVRTLTYLPDIIIGFLSTLDWGLVARSLSDFIIGALDEATVWLESHDWNELGQTLWRKLKDVVTNIDFAGIASSLFALLGTAIRSAAEFLGGFFGSIGADIKRWWDEEIAGQNWIETAGNLLAAIGKGFLGIGGWVLENIVDPFIGGLLGEDTWSGMKDVGKNIIEGLWKGITDFLSDPLGWLKEHLVDPIVDGVKNLLGVHSPSTVFSEIGGYVIEGFFNGISEAWGSIVDFFGEKLEAIKSLISDAWGAIKETASTIWGEIKGAVGDIWDSLSKKASEVWGSIKETVGTAWDKVKETTGNTWDKIKSGVSSTWEGIKTTAGTVWDTIKGKITGANSDSKEAVEGNWSDVKSSLSTTWGTLSEESESTFSQIGSFIQGSSNKTKSIISDAWSNVKTDMESKLSSISSSVSSIFSNLVSKATSWGRDLCSNIANGIKGAVGTVTSAASNLAGKIKSYIHFSEPDVGPLSDFHTYMPDMLATMAKGIRDNTYLATNAVSELAGSVSKQFSNLSYDVPKPKFSNVAEMQMNYQVAYAGGYQDPQSGNYAEAAGGTNADVVNAILAMATQIVTAINEKDTSVNIDGERLTRRISSLQAQQERMYRR